jgi:hypothetical protein
MERAAAGIDFGQISGGDRDLHRAGHREGHVAVDANDVAGRQVERRQAVVAGIRRRGGDEALLELLQVQTRGGGRHSDEQSREPRNKPEYAHPITLHDQHIESQADTCLANML